MKTNIQYRDVESYITSTPKSVQSILRELRKVILESAPQANESISYKIPFYEYGGAGYKGRLIYFSASSTYIAVYIPPSRIGKTSEALKKYQVSVSAYHFPIDKPFPFALISKTVKQMVSDIDSGKRKG